MQIEKQKIVPYLLALITVSVWGLTFVSTKILLESFQPVEILFLRFMLGFIALCFVRRHILRVKEKRHHLIFAVAGLCGVCLYFLLENIALQFCTASNISVTVSVAPMLTALIATVVRKKRALHKYFVGGFVLAIVGIIMTSFADVSTMQVGFGDLLAICAALTWACYSNLIDYLSECGYETIAITKRCFAWGLVFIAIAMPFFGASPSMLTGLINPVNLFNLAFLGLGASAACFSLWGYCVQRLGVAQASAFIYLAPPITMLAGVLVLGEPFTTQSLFGLLLVLGGLMMSEYKPKHEKQAE